MSVIEEKVAELEARLAELEPVLREAEDLKESIASLRAILDREKPSPDDEPKWTSHFEERRKRPYMSLSARKRQISEVLAADPGATNAEIAERLGITAARVGQIRQQM